MQGFVALHWIPHIHSPCTIDQTTDDLGYLLQICSQNLTSFSPIYMKLFGLAKHASTRQLGCQIPIFKPPYMTM